MDKTDGPLFTKKGDGNGSTGEEKGLREEGWTT